MAERRKEIHFDLNIERLKQFYPGSGKNAYLKAWDDIKTFLLNNGFEHSQQSGYSSIKPLKANEVRDILQALQDTYPWFALCANAVSISNFTHYHDALSSLDAPDEQDYLRSIGRAPEVKETYSLDDVVSACTEQAYSQDFGYDSIMRDDFDIRF